MLSFICLQKYSSLLNLNYEGNNQAVDTSTLPIIIQMHEAGIVAMFFFV